MAVHLGAFRLIAPLGTGGVAVAWRAVHTSGVPVAVKVLHARFADQALSKRSFAQEVRALARLDHPGIAAVLDFGEVDAATALASDGELVAGVPWFALELGSAGSLADRVHRPTSWDGLAALLWTLLSALGHAHARGVLHRDCKPQNVVIRGTEDHRTGPMWVDFGLASFLGAAPDAGTETSGTRGYRSPEQHDGDWRAFGPWTDLYALGVMAEQLALGLQVPAGWDAWVARATAADPADRFDSAAAALAALPRPRPRRPGRWPGVPPILSTIGLPLLELRRPRLVGRRREQRLLLSAQRRVARTGRPAHLALRGPPGVGRSALVQWLAERSHETGDAGVVSLVADPDGAVAGPTLRRWSESGQLGRAALAAFREPAPDDARLVAVLAALARERPVLLTADPADDAGPILRAVLRLEAPILVVSVGAPVPSGLVLDVAPLSVRTLCRVLDELLPLERSTVLRIAAEADGRVAHARLVLAHYVRGGGMVERDGRWALDGSDRPGFEDRVPRIEQIVGGGSLIPLGVAAALGPRVVRRIWEQACDPPPALLPALLAAGLVEETTDGFAHLQPTFRAAVLALLGRQGLAVEVHGRCADSLPTDTPRRQLVVGTHLRLAGRLPEAERVLRDAVRGLDRDLAYDEVLVALAEVERCGNPADRPWVRRQRLYALIHVGSHDAAATEAEVLLAEALSDGDRELASDAARILAVARMRTGRRDDAEAAAHQAVALGRGTPFEVHALLVWIDCLIPARLDEAADAAARMLALADGPSWGTATHRLGRIAHLRGEREQARALLLSVVDRGDMDSLDVRSSRVALGDLLREDGDLAGAERHYLAAIDGLTPFVEGGEGLAVGLLNLAVVALERGDPGAARQRLARLAEACGALTRSLVPLVDLVTAACAADLGDMEELDARLARVLAAAEEPVLWQADSVRLLRRCATRARAAGRTALASGAEALAEAFAARLAGGDRPMS